MEHESENSSKDRIVVVLATREAAAFRPGDRVTILNRSPVGHSSVPRFLREKTGWVESVIEPRSLENEAGGFRRRAGQTLHYYRIAMRMTEIGISGGTVKSLKSSFGKLNVESRTQAVAVVDRRGLLRQTPLAEQKDYGGAEVFSGACA